MMMNELREALAAEQHEIRSHWMRYLFTQGYPSTEGVFIINGVSVDRWERQMNTLYADLTEKEKESDRDQADKVLAVLAMLGVEL